MNKVGIIHSDDLYGMELTESFYYIVEKVIQSMIKTGIPLQIQWNIFSMHGLALIKALEKYPQVYLHIYYVGNYEFSNDSIREQLVARASSMYKVVRKDQKTDRDLWKTRLDNHVSYFSDSLVFIKKENSIISPKLSFGGKVLYYNPLSQIITK